MTVNRSPNSLAATSQPSSEFFRQDRKSTRLNSSHSQISYAVFCLKKKKLYPNLCLLSLLRSPPIGIEMSPSLSTLITDVLLKPLTATQTLSSTSPSVPQLMQIPPP